MIGGFAFATAPAEYRITGVKTFIVGYDGVVYQKDSGPDTLQIFKEMELYNPTTDDWPWDRCPQTSDFGQAKLTKIECVESATCGVRKDGVFGQASSQPRRLIQGGSRMRRSARTDLCGGDQR